MNERNRMPMLVLAAASFALFGAGCSDQTPTSTSSTTTAPTVGQKMESAADKVANATDKATVNAAAAIDDATITTKVKAAVLAEPGLKSLQDRRRHEGRRGHAQRHRRLAGAEGTCDADRAERGRRAAGGRQPRREGVLTST